MDYSVDTLFKPFISVIVPVFDNINGLKNCLNALEHQSYPQTSYEVIVVDNGSNHNTRSIVALFKQVIIEYEHQSGSYAARNKGISCAIGDIIAFTDSDCIPAVDWLEKGSKKLLSEPNCGLVGGKIIVFPEDPSNPNLVELYDIISAFHQQNYIEKERFSATANLFTFKKVIIAVGCFDKELKSCGDYEWGTRVSAAGYKQSYADEAIVLHPARKSVIALIKQSLRFAGGHYDLKRKYSKLKPSFDKGIIKNLLPLNSVLKVFNDERVCRLEEKLKLTLIILIKNHCMIFEKIRLTMGGKSRR